MWLLHITPFLYPPVPRQASIEQSKTQYLEVLKENTRRLNKVSELQHSKKELEKRLNARQKAMVGLVHIHTTYIHDSVCVHMYIYTALINCLPL